MLIHSPDAYLSTLIAGAGNAAEFALKLFAIYAVWMIVLKIFEKTGLSKGLSRLLRPVLKRLFPKEKEDTMEYISLNLSANMLGMGGAATPMGLRAMETMEEKRNRIMLVVVNATSIQLIPTTILGMRAEWGGVADVILPSLIATFLTTAAGILLVKLFVK